MNRLGIMTCVGSAILSLGLGYAFIQRLEVEVAGGPKTSVLVAAEDIPVAATLQEKHLALRDIPRGYLESRHILASDLKKVIGQRVTDAIKANEALLTTDVAKLVERRSLSGRVTNGMRAIAIDGRAADFDGLLRPSDRVDVLLSLGTASGASGTTTLLQNLLVLAVGGTLSRSDTKETTYSRGATVTLGATVEQAQLLTEAMRRGKLTLTLRNGDDITLVEGVQETTEKDLTARSSQSVRSVPQVPVKEGVDHAR